MRSIRKSWHTWVTWCFVSQYLKIERFVVRVAFKPSATRWQCCDPASAVWLHQNTLEEQHDRSQKVRPKHLDGPLVAGCSTAHRVIIIIIAVMISDFHKILITLLLWYWLEWLAQQQSHTEAWGVSMCEFEPPTDERMDWTDFRGAGLFIIMCFIDMNQYLIFKYKTYCQFITPPGWM